MKLKIFQYAVLLHPKSKKEKDEEGKTILLVEPQTILAADDKQAAILVARQIPEKHLDDLENIEVLIRPF